MARRWKLWVIGISVAATAVLLGWWATGKVLAPPLRPENFNQLRTGMPQSEVEELLGGPPGNYGHGGEAMMTDEGFRSPPGSVQRIWCDDKNRLELYFDTRARLVGYHKRAGYTQSPPDGFLARPWQSSRRFLGL